MRDGSAAPWPAVASWGCGRRAVLALLGLLALAVPGCTAGGSAPEGGGDPFAPPSPGKAIKVTYIRFNWSPQAKAWRHEYRVMLSDGWRVKNGQSPREPFAKLWKDAFRGEIQDFKMQELVDMMVKFGLDDLRPTPIDQISLDELKRVERLPYDRAETVNRWRIINVETDAIRKTVTCSDNDDGGGELTKKFARVEREVIKAAVQYTVQVSYEAPPMIPK